MYNLFLPLQIESCKAEKDGGGISFKDPVFVQNATADTPRVHLKNSSLETNEAHNGGALFVTAIEGVIIEDSRINDNAAFYGGGRLGSL